MARLGLNDYTPPTKRRRTVSTDPNVVNLTRNVVNLTSNNRNIIPNRVSFVTNPVSQNGRVRNALTRSSSSRVSNGRGGLTSSGSRQVRTASSAARSGSRRNGRNATIGNQVASPARTASAGGLRRNGSVATANGRNATIGNQIASLVRNQVASPARTASASRLRRNGSVATANGRNATIGNQIASLARNRGKANVVVNQPPYHVVGSRHSRIVSGVRPHQQHALNKAKLAVNAMVRKGRTPRGSIVFHGTGSGKTLVAGLIAMEYLSRVDPKPYVFILSTPGNIQQLKDGLKEQIGRHASSNLYRLLRSQNVQTTEMETANHLKHLNHMLTKGSGPIFMKSYEEFASCMGKFGNRSISSSAKCAAARDWKAVGKGLVLILDEAHELLRPLNAMQVKEKMARGTKSEDPGLHLTRRFIEEHRHDPLLHVHALTATLGASIEQVNGLLSLAGVNMAPTGNTMISFANMSENTRIFAPSTHEVVGIQLHPRHWDLYVRDMNKLKQNEYSKTVPSTVSRVYSKFWNTLQERFVKYAFLSLMNYIPTTQKNEQNILDILKSPGGYRYERMHVERPDMKTDIDVVVGPKMFQLVDNLQKDGKHFVYVRDKQEVYILRHLLMTKLRYSDITSSYKTTGHAVLSRRMNRPNFVWTVADTPPLVMQRFMSGLDKIDKVITPELLRRNDRGQNCKIIICTGKSYQGTDINSLRYVHLLTPFPTKLQFRQASGRGARQGGHHFHDPNNRTYRTEYKKVKINEYCARAPPDGVRYHFLSALHDEVTNTARTTVQNLNKTRMRNGADPNPSADELMLRHRALNPKEIALNEHINRIKRRDGVIAPGSRR